MGWQDELLPASFRGVPFKVKGHELGTGRATSVAEIPYRDLPIVQDLGRSTRKFEVEGFVVGDDYLHQRDLLLAALESSEGPGELHHPYLGVRIVRVTDGGVRLRESVDEGRMATFSMQFVEAELQPTHPRPRASETIDERASVLQDAASAELVDELVVEDVPQEVIDATTNEVTKFGKLIESLGTLGGLEAEAAALGNQARVLILNATSLALAPADLAFAIKSAVDLVEDTVSNGFDALRVYRQLDALVPELLSSVLERANAELVVSTVRISALSGWARALGSIEWASYEDAVAARREWEAVLNAAILESRGEKFNALSALAATVAGAVPPPDRDLPHVTSFSPRALVPAIALAYQLYDDVDRASDLIARNRIRNPLFVAGGVELEVLTRE